MQLAGRKDAFDAQNVGLAAMTYDARELLAAFQEEAALGYPLLQDVDAVHVTAWGVLNEAYAPGNDNHGLPHPGIVWIDGDGVVRAKWAVPGYRDRPPLDAVLAEIRMQLAR